MRDVRFTSKSRHAQAPVAALQSARHHDLHNVGAARHPSPAKRDRHTIFGTTPFAAPGLGIVAAAIMLGFTLLIGSDQKVGL
jgi:hypothetical protein